MISEINVIELNVKLLRYAMKLGAIAILALLVMVGCDRAPQ